MRCTALLAGALLALPALAWADGAAPDARALGFADAMLGYCAKADPSGAAKERERVERLTHGASVQALAAARGSPEYRRAYDAETAFAGKINDGNARRFCSGSAARGR